MLDSPRLQSCPVCVGPRRPRQTYCSAKCRSKAWQRRRAEILAERDARLGALAEAILKELGENPRS